MCVNRVFYSLVGSVPFDMAAGDLAFDVCGLRVVEDLGKVVLSEQVFESGHVIYREQAFVAASWSTVL